MRVLIACEYSGTVRDAFLRRGHDAWSCDIIETETPGPHLVRDALEVVLMGWDLMIAHPPCRYLAASGNAHLGKPGRAELTDRAAQFFLALWNSPIHKIAVENPKGAMTKLLRSPDQYIEPYDHGHDERKKTGLWLKNLPLLQPSVLRFPPGPTYVDRNGKNRYFTDSKSSGPKQAHERARTFQGIADAMAAQWG